MFEYSGYVLDVIDGDTVTLFIDLGFNIWIKENARLAEIDTPELRSKDETERGKAYAAKHYLEQLVLKREVIVNTRREDKYGRYLVHLVVDGIDVNRKMVEDGYAVKYE